jgi:DNA-binding XRE family transcriptional regulator
MNEKLVLRYAPEVWTVILDATKYQISNKGRVKNNKEEILTPQLVTGYPRVCLYEGTGKKTCKLIHVLVAEAFIPNPQNKSQVNHINGIKTDNDVSNLEWVTPSENLIHAYANGLREDNRKGENNGFAKLTEIDVFQIKLMLAEGELTQKEIASMFGVSRSAIKDIKTGRTWNHVESTSVP